MKRTIVFIFVLAFITGCKKEDDRIFIPKDVVIAHRGTTYWAPEETEAAYLWARDIGAHYLEVDIQRSKDGVLLVLHDNQLTRTTNIADVFPERSELPSSSFTFEELLLLDAGSWFNKAYPERAKLQFSDSAHIIPTNQRIFYFDELGQKNYSSLNSKAYLGGKQQLLCLEDVIRIAEGYRIVKDKNGNRLYKKMESNDSITYRFYYVDDEEATNNRPGVYIETKEPELFPGVELELFNKLDELGWNQLTKHISDTNILKEGNVNIANTSARIILQTFSPNSLKEIHHYFKAQIPVTFLLWLGDANMPTDDSVRYFKNLEFAAQYEAQIIGPSIGGAPNNYSDLLKESHHDWIKSKGFLIHPYSFDTQEQTKKYGPISDGMFTNRAELSLKYLQEK